MNAEWTTEYPKGPGYYWVRNYRLYPNDEPTPGPAIAEIETDNGDLLCYLPGSGDFNTKYEFSGEWFGPIQPPEDTND